MTHCTGADADKGASQPVSENLPTIAYVLLWFPLSSETFIFREVVQLMARGLPIRAYTMYGKSLSGCSEEMRNFPGPVERMGVGGTLRILQAFLRALGRTPLKVLTLMRKGFFHRMRNMESLGENLWCCGGGPGGTGPANGYPLTLIRTYPAKRRALSEPVRFFGR